MIVRPLRTREEVLSGGDLEAALTIDIDICIITQVSFGYANIPAP